MLDQVTVYPTDLQLKDPDAEIIKCV